ncbi:MAG: hypothetical protein ACE5IR_17185 [bacterium]
MNSHLSEISNLNGKVKGCYLDLEDLLHHLGQFEQTHNMSSQEFLRNFSKGNLKHETEFFEWYAYLDMSKKLLTKIRDLERELGVTLEQKLLATD